MRWCVIHDAQVVEPEDAPGIPDPRYAWCWRSLWHEVDPLRRECELVDVYEEPQSQMERLPIEEPVPEGWYEIVATDTIRMVAKPVGSRRILPDPKEPA